MRYTHDPKAVERILEPHEPRGVVMVPVYSGDLGARGVIDHWQAIVRLYCGTAFTGHGATIDAAIRDAMEAGE